MKALAKNKPNHPPTQQRGRRGGKRAKEIAISVANISAAVEYPVALHTLISLIGAFYEIIVM